MTERQEKVDAIWVQLHVRKAVPEVLEKFDEVATIARLNPKNELIDKILTAVIAVLEELQEKIMRVRQKQSLDKEEKLLLLAQAAGLQNAIKALTKEPYDVDDARAELKEVLKLSQSEEKYAGARTSKFEPQ